MIRLIIATDPNGLMGLTVNTPEDPCKPKMPWYYKQDLRRFKRITMGGVLIMGRTTWDSLPGKLPGRDHVILSRTPDQLDLPEGCFSAGSLDQALEMRKPSEDIWIAGGLQVYLLALNAGVVEEIDHTFVPEVDVAALEDVVGVVTFDLAALDEFELVYSETNSKDDRLTHRRFRCRSLPSKS